MSKDNLGNFRPQDAPRYADVLQCMRCGFCLPTCPTYQLWGEEMDSPRGRIHLVSQILDGAPLTAAAAEHFDRCLGCMACMTACPSGVQYDQIIEAARVWAEAPAVRPPVKVNSAMRRSASIASTVERSPGTTLIVPGGAPASSNTAATSSAVRAVWLAGLITVALPATNEGATLWMTRLKGALKGVTAPTTPTG